MSAVAARQEATRNELAAVGLERERQHELHAKGKHRFEMSGSVGTPAEYLAVLAEEFGEVSRHVADFVINPSTWDREEVRDELIQVAAVAVGWAERLTREIEQDADARSEARAEEKVAGMPFRPDIAVQTKVPAVIIYDGEIPPLGCYTDAELADWQRDPELGA